MSTSRIIVAAGGVVGIVAASVVILVVTSSGGAATNEVTSSAAQQISALSGARTPSDALPQSVADAVTGLNDATDVPVSELPGAALVNESHLLLAAQGATQADLYAVPTSSGEACYVLNPGPVGCVQNFSGTTAVGWAIFDPGQGSGESAMVFGIAPDQVNAVDVVVSGTDYPATLKNNGFFYQLPESTDLISAISAIKVFYIDGTSATIDVHPSAPPSPGSS